MQSLQYVLPESPVMYTPPCVLAHPSSFLLLRLSLGDPLGDVFQSFTGSRLLEREPQFPDDDARLATSSSWSLHIITQ